MGNEVNEVINNICNKLGYAAAEITPEFAKYMIAQNIFALLVCLILGSCCVVVGLKAYKSYLALDAHDREWYSGGQMFLMAVGAIGTVIIVVVMGAVGADLAGWIVAPKASMVKYVLSMIH